MAGSAGGTTSASTASSPSCAPSSCGTSARPCPRRPRSSCCRVWRRCRSGSMPTWRGRAPSPSGSRRTHAPRSRPGRASGAIRITPAPRAVAECLGADLRVSFVSWAGLESHPHHARAARYLPLGPGSVFAFGVRPTGEFTTDEEEATAARTAGEQVIANLQLASHLANIGDARTLVLHPASTTHRQLSAEQLAAGGVRPDLIRISVGLEDVADILWD